MITKLTYQTAAIADAALLSAISYASKQFWGYSAELMNLWKSDLEITAQYILDNTVVKVFDNENLIGFFAIKPEENNSAELDHLWLKPENIQRNYGRQIFQHIIEDLANKGYSKMTLIAEPHAVGFYQKMNGRVVGKFQSKIKDRVLDIYEFQVNSAAIR